MLLCLALLAPALAQAAEVSMFGPETFDRSSGSPVTVTNNFSVPLQRDGIIHIQNSLLDDPVTSELVSSSIITLNGTNVVTPASFNQTVTGLEIPISLVAGANTLTVEVRGKPGTGLTLETFAFDEPPVAAFTPTPSTGPVPLTVAFDASATTDPDITNPATTDILTYAWDFGDGATGTGVTVSHVYATPGTFTATLTVTDVFGLSSTATTAVTVINTAPVAAFTPTPATGPVPLTVSFDASASTDAENNIATYAWDFGDTTTGTGVTTTHQYITPGTFTATLTVTDVFGLFSTATAAVTVINTAPVAAFTPTPATGQIPLAVSFDASASTDAENNISTYAWNFGDGTTGTGVTTTHIYNAGGLFTVTLTVTDAFGLSSQATATIDAIAGQPPVAVFFPATFSGRVPLTVTFDASLSTDPDDDIATYTWDFGDGTAAGSGVTVTHTYPAAGTFTATLTVTDAIGLSNQATESITVIPNAPPNIAITSPGGGSLVIQNRPLLKLSYADDLAVDTNSIALSANGAPLAVTCAATESSATCTPTADLPQGNVTLSASISDFEGLSATSVPVAFTVDSVPVEVAIISPIDRAITKDAQTVVSGAIGPTVVSVEVNGVTATITGANFTATVPLREGKNMLIATARNTNNKPGVSTVDVTRDIQKPIVRINSPADGFVAVENTLTVTGIVNDIVDGGVLPTVKVNGIPVPVVNGTFVALNVPLGLGPNTIEAVATDGVGNEGRHSINVTFNQVVGPRILIASGNGLSGTISQPLAQPLVAVVQDELGNPVAGRLVRFEVTRNNGTLSGDGVAESSRIITVSTDGAGKASVTLTLGNTAGGGNNRVKVTSVGVAGEIEFCATGLPKPPSQIINEMGDNQRGTIGEPLPIPLEALAVDAGGNPVAEVDVTFNVTKGGGSFDGQNSTIVTTGSDGIARVVFTIGFEAGINNNVAIASFQGLTSLSAIFTASGLVSGDPADTTFSGVVLDAGQAPISGATVTIEGTAVSGITDAEGRFLLAGVPVGAFVLKVDPASSPRPETFPPLEFEIVTIAGVENILGMPVILPEIDTDTAKLVGGNEDVVLEMKGVPGATLTVLANSATFPDGSTTGLASVSQVHMDQVPMRPPNGTLPPLAGTLQPLEAKFDPPVRVQFPNSNGLAPGTIIDMFQFHHDTSRFVPVGKGTVTADGRFVVSDPGFGLQTGGWHVTSPPPPPPACAPSCTQCNTPVVTDQQTCTFTCEPQTGPACDDGDQCTAGDVCTNGTCGGNQDDAEGVACDDGVVCTGNDTCQGGSCQGDPAAADGLACNDEKVCTANDVCQGGSCQGDPAAADGLACNDEKVCTANDVCQGGSCVGDPAAADGVPCDDQNLCTGNDVCTGGSCVGDPAAAEGLVCDDEILCTGNDVCTGGSCVGDPAAADGVVCDDGEVCTGNDVCTGGTCVGDASAQESVACDDKNDCTGNDVCQAGACVGDPAVKEGQNCDDGAEECVAGAQCIAGICEKTKVEIERIEGACIAPLGETAQFFGIADGGTSSGFGWTGTNAQPTTSTGLAFVTAFQTRGTQQVTLTCNLSSQQKKVNVADSCTGPEFDLNAPCPFGFIKEGTAGICTKELLAVDTIIFGGPKHGKFNSAPFNGRKNFEFKKAFECVNNNLMCLAVKLFLWEYAIRVEPLNPGPNGQPRIDINSIQQVNPGNCKGIIDSFKVDPTTRTPKFLNYWSSSIVREHEEFHQQDFLIRVVDPVIADHRTRLAGICSSCGGTPLPASVNRAMRNDFFQKGLQYLAPLPGFPFLQGHERRALVVSNGRHIDLIKAINAIAIQANLTIPGSWPVDCESNPGSSLP